MTQQFDFLVDNKSIIGDKSAHHIINIFAETAECISKNYNFWSLLNKFIGRGVYSNNAKMNNSQNEQKWGCKNEQKIEKRTLNKSSSMAERISIFDIYDKKHDLNNDSFYFFLLK